MGRQVWGIVAVLVALGGCTGESAAPGTVTTTTTTATSGTAPATPVDLREVEEALNRTVESTGRLRESTVLVDGPDSLSTVVEVEFDGVTGNRGLVRTVEASSQRAFDELNGSSGVTPDELEARVRYVEGVLYLNLPATRGDRWTRYIAQDTGDAMSQLGITLDGDSAQPAALLAMIAGADRQATRSDAGGGATRYRLSLPAALAATHLPVTMTRMLVDADRGPDELSGQVELEVVVGDGTITSAELDATRLYRQLRELAGEAAAEVTVTMTLDVVGLGGPFTVEAPPEQLVDDA